MAQRDIRAMLGVLAAATAITAQAESALRRAGSGMRASEWDVLVTLHTYGAMRPAEVVRQAAMAVNAPTVHAILGRLEGRGLITREAHPEQLRAVLVTLTDAGSQAVDSLFPILERKVINGFSGHYSEHELDQIVELMERL
jgi:DNA-binding MarR family transcriptional regulator